MTDSELLSRLENWKIAAAFVVAIGVAAEFGLEFWSRPLLRRVEAAHAAEMGRLTNEAEQARKEAAEGRERAAAANERAAGLEKRAAELEADVQPRDLTVAQQARLRDALKPFTKHIVSVRSYAMDLEGKRLARLLRSVFESVPMPVSDNTGNLFNLAGNFVVGIQVAGPFHDKHVVESIAMALRSEGKLDVVVKSDATIDKDALVEVLVGVKPLRP